MKQPGQPAGARDNTRVTDRTAQPGTGTIELSYSDPQFDQKLWSGNYSTLKI